MMALRALFKNVLYASAKICKFKNNFFYYKLGINSFVLFSNQVIGIKIKFLIFDPILRLKNLFLFFDSVFGIRILKIIFNYDFKLLL